MPPVSSFGTSIVDKPSRGVIAGLLEPSPASLLKLTWLLVLAACPFPSDAAAPSDLAQLDFFEKKIRPVLAQQCYECHSATAKKVKGGLLLDTREGVLKGGDSGEAVVPGKPQKSLLLSTMKHEDADESLHMPPKKEKLSDEVIADFEKWIKMGAPDPRDGKVTRLAWDPEVAKKHWSFKPIAKPTPPQVADTTGFVQSPIDQFILAKLKEKGLEPSKKADKHTLIRRVTYDLTGLPPTPEQVDAFVADTDPKAFEKLVDRLLASPQYGERWARHWLDVARYADTTGDRQANRRQPLLPHAWTYRDYVIDAFNKDLPYDRFLLEQIAADRLPESKENPKMLAAMGFITAGKGFMGNENEVLDDRIDVVTKGVMGLTAACARCHDHKFDPIPTADYYSLHGIFSSSEVPTPLPLIVAKPEANPQYADFMAKVSEVEKEVELFSDKEGARRLIGILTRAGDFMLMAHESESSGDSRKKGNNFRLAARERGLEAELAAMALDKVKSLVKGEGKDPVFGPWVAFTKLPAADFTAKAPALATEIAASKDVNPLIAKAFAGKQPASLKDVGDIYTAVLSELPKQMKAGKYVSGVRAMRDSDFKYERTKAPLADAEWEALRQHLFAETSPMLPDTTTLSRALGVQFSNPQNAIRGKIFALEMTHPGAPARAMALQDTSRPRDSRVFIRCEPGNRGDVAPRQFLTVLSGPDRKPFPQDTSGRLELAKAIADRGNPLTARVLVNRAWQWHFGQAIVRTVSDFGTRSEPPTHPGLLDWMASWFMENGWSLKKLHKLMVMTGSYQQDSRPTAKGMTTDATNQWLWRYNIQRLDFEELRDTMLVLGGNLDAKMGGQPVPIAAPTGQSNRYGSPMAGAISDKNPNRRTVYAMIDRAALPDMFQTFDFANPDMSTGERVLTTVPQQALFMLNSPFVAEQVKQILQRKDFPASGSADEKVRFLFRIAFQRAPRADELKMALAYLEEQEAEARPAAALSQSVAAAPKSSEEIAAAEKAARQEAKLKRKSAAATASRQLNSFERYAQVVLLSNELIFVN